ncbi:MAG: Holliday junction branch migration protein RuvA [Clostridia bacterium]|nr:Holliday junction branch migration protein RuvA [Clostridia bacterium]
MIAFLRGEIAQKTDGKIFIEANGVGFEVLVSNTTLTTIGAEGENIMIHTYMHVKDDGITLYGFSSTEEKQLFEQLISVNGVGPKGALAVLSSMKLSDLLVCISSGDSTAISRAKGLGKKTAERIVLELQHKVSPMGFAVLSDEFVMNTNTDAMDEAYAVLISLGLTKSESLSLVRKNSSGTDTAEEIVAKVLKDMGR